MPGPSRIGSDQVGGQGPIHGLGGSPNPQPKKGIGGVLKSVVSKVRGTSSKAKAAVVQRWKALDKAVKVNKLGTAASSENRVCYNNAKQISKQGLLELPTLNAKLQGDGAKLANVHNAIGKEIAKAILNEMAHRIDNYGRPSSDFREVMNGYLIAHTSSMDAGLKKELQAAIREMDALDLSTDEKIEQNREVLGAYGDKMRDIESKFNRALDGAGEDWENKL